MTSKLVLFVCTHNKGRSQIANAFFNQLADPRDWRLRDPSSLSVDEVRVIRDEVRRLVADLVHDMGWAREVRPRPHLVPTITG